MKNIKTYDNFLSENYNQQLNEGISIKIPENIQKKLQSIAVKYKKHFTKLVKKFEGKSVEEIMSIITNEKPEIATVVESVSVNENILTKIKEKLTSVSEIFKQYLGQMAIGGFILTVLIPSMNAILTNLDVNVLNQYQDQSAALAIALGIFSIVAAIASNRA